MLDEFERCQLRYITKACTIPRQKIGPRFLDPAGKFTGAANPEDVTAIYHLEMIRTGLSHYSARREMKLSLPAPAWCAERFGQSSTRLSVGRWVQIGDEHEDSYHSDFAICSDVIVHDAQGGVRMLFYPREVFSPTDFHSATLLDERILLIGSLSYGQMRRPGEKQIMQLDLDDFSISTVVNFGQGPGWINRRKAELREGEIVVSGGQVQGETRYVDFAGRFALSPSEMSWRNLDNV